MIKQCDKRRLGAGRFSVCTRSYLSRLFNFFFLIVVNPKSVWTYMMKIYFHDKKTAKKHIKKVFFITQKVQSQTEAPNLFFFKTLLI